MSGDNEDWIYDKIIAAQYKIKGKQAPAPKISIPAPIKSLVTPTVPKAKKRGFIYRPAPKVKPKTKKGFTFKAEPRTVRKTDKTIAKEKPPVKKNYNSIKPIATKKEPKPKKGFIFWSKPKEADTEKAIVKEKPPVKKDLNTIKPTVTNKKPKPKKGFIFWSRPKADSKTDIVIAKEKTPVKKDIEAIKPIVTPTTPKSKKGFIFRPEPKAIPKTNKVVVKEKPPVKKDINTIEPIIKEAPQIINTKGLSYKDWPEEIRHLSTPKENASLVAFNGRAITSLEEFYKLTYQSYQNEDRSVSLQIIDSSKKSKKVKVPMRRLWNSDRIWFKEQGFNRL